VVAVRLEPTRPVLRGELALELGRAFTTLGDLDQAAQQAVEALNVATEAGNVGLAAQARLLKLEVAVSSGALLDVDPIAVEEANTAVREAEESGDPIARTLAYQARGFAAHMGGQAREAQDYSRRALEQAEASGDRFLLLEIEMQALTGKLIGSNPASEVVAAGEAMVRKTRDYPSIRADALRILAVGEAMLGRFDDARTHAQESIATLEDLGNRESAVLSRGDKAWVERLAGDGETAEADLRLVIAAAEATGNRTLSSWAAGRLLPWVLADGRYDDALQLANQAAEVAIVMNNTRVLGARARIAAVGGDPAAAELVTTLLHALAEVEGPNIIIDGFVDAAEASSLLGDRASAVRYAEEALRLAVEKENVARAEQVREVIGRVGQAAEA
jgi:tetratricopeptide (TPR) repeat protein